ncbi:MAG: 30S ribosomal protein S18 [Planctomycetota bacterium]|jgi:ribosomal protein S18/ribosomal protein S6
MKPRVSPEGPRKYEVMFLVDSAAAAKDWDGIESHMKELIEQCGGIVLSAGKWDERKLAFEISGVRRGTYWLAYVQAPTEMAAKLHKELFLSGRVLRCMVLAISADAEVPEDVTTTRMVLSQEEMSRGRRERVKVKKVNYKDIPVLQKLTTGQGKLYSRKRSGLTARLQRQLKTAIKRARYMSLMPYVAM